MVLGFLVVWNSGSDFGIVTFYYWCISYWDCDLLGTVKMVLRLLGTVEMVL
jgi:hypothetical protein